MGVGADETVGAVVVVGLLDGSDETVGAWETVGAAVDLKVQQRLVKAKKGGKNDMRLRMHNSTRKRTKKQHCQRE